MQAFELPTSWTLILKKIKLYGIDICLFSICIIWEYIVHTLSYLTVCLCICQCLIGVCVDGLVSSVSSSPNINSIISLELQSQCSNTVLLYTSFATPI